MDWITYLVIPFVKVVIAIGALMMGVMVMILAERRISAWIQDRHGPNRVGWHGIMQPMADGLKFLLKEDLIPAHVDKVLYVMAPAIILVPALMTWAVVPFGTTDLQQVPKLLGRPFTFQLTDLNIGILYILAITSLGVYGIVLGAWASNNKYSLLGGLRASAQMISYEISLGLSIIGVLLVSGSLKLTDIVAQQQHFWNWNVFRQFPAFLVFTVASFAETNRAPFDLAEAEQELVGGYHTEYSSLKFAMYFMAEYLHMIVGSAVNVSLFFGGWHLFGLENIHWILSVLIVMAKMGLLLFLYIWVRWTLPRFRYDQLMMLGWKVLLPIALADVIGTSIVLAL